MSHTIEISLKNGGVLTETVSEDFDISASMQESLLTIFDEFNEVVNKMWKVSPDLLVAVSDISSIKISSQTTISWQIKNSA